MDRTLPQEAAANEPVEITLSGKVYPFREPSRRRSHYLYGVLSKIYFGHGIVNEEQIRERQEAGDADMEPPDSKLTMAAGAAGMTAIPDLLDFLYDALEVGRKDIAKIEETFEVPEVIAACELVAGVISRPFVGGDSNSASQEMPETPSTSGESATK